MKTRVIGVALDQRRQDVDRITEAGAQYTHVTGDIECNGVGAAIVDILFPCLFVEPPRPSYMGELAPGEALVTGDIPTCSIVILDWDLRPRTDGSTAIYAGVTLGIVTTGPTGQTMIAHWNMEGPALQGPNDG